MPRVEPTFIDVDTTTEEHEVAKLRQHIQRSKFLVALTGAGISYASGLPLEHESIHGVTLERFFEPALLQEDPRKFYQLYRHFLRTWRQKRPNKAHNALAAAGVWVITQNIDGLHTDAGTKHIIELHGNLRELRCTVCGHILNSTMALEADLPRCPDCSRILVPGFSLMGSPIRHFSRAVDWCGRAQTLLVIGTELDKHPVRDLPNALPDEGILVRVNHEAEQVVPRLFL